MPFPPAQISAKSEAPNGGAGGGGGSSAGAGGGGGGDGSGTTFDVNVLLGRRDDPLLVIYARQMIEAIRCVCVERACVCICPVSSTSTDCLPPCLPAMSSIPTGCPPACLPARLTDKLADGLTQCHKHKHDHTTHPASPPRGRCSSPSRCGSGTPRHSKRSWAGSRPCSDLMVVETGRGASGGIVQ